LDEIILLAVNGASHLFFESSENLRPKWHRDTPQLSARGFDGQYFFKGKYIPIFEVYGGDSKQVFVLNKTKLGQLKQHSPLNEGEDSELRRDILYIRAEAFSENVALTEEFLNNPPPWLKDQGDTNAQREYLRARALVRILERFEFQASKQFEGYRITLGE
jgi:hypothetical protein